MKIYITNLSEYNAGSLVGEWFELPCSKEELQAAINRVACNYEEYFITDSEGVPFDIGEYDNPYRLNEKLEQYEALGDHERLCVAFLLSEDYEWQHAMDHHEKVILYAGEHLKDVVYSLVEDGCFGPVGDGLNNYIDYAAIARDLSFDGYVERAEGVFCYAG